MSQTVADVMTANPICVAPSTPLNEAVQPFGEASYWGATGAGCAGSLSGDAIRVRSDATGIGHYTAPIRDVFRFGYFSQNASSL